MFNIIGKYPVHNRLFIGIMLLCMAVSLLGASQSFKASLTACHDHQPETFYSHLPFDKNGQVRLKPGPNKPTLLLPIQWVPILPLSEFFKEDTCYREKICVDKQGKKYGGLTCCQKMHPKYSQIKVDRYNYVPEIKLYHNDFKNELVDPAPQYRGFIARTLLYLHDTYAIRISTAQRQIYQIWDYSYPPSSWELVRHEKIATFQKPSPYYRHAKPTPGA